jgi:hypothetical protein
VSLEYQHCHVLPCCGEDKTVTAAAATATTTTTTMTTTTASSSKRRRRLKIQESVSQIVDKG